MTDVVCDDDIWTWDHIHRNAIINLEADETVTCTFTNTPTGDPPEEGIIIIIELEESLSMGELGENQTETSDGDVKDTGPTIEDYWWIILVIIISAGTAIAIYNKYYGKDPDVHPQGPDSQPQGPVDHPNVVTIELEAKIE